MRQWSTFWGAFQELLGPEWQRRSSHQSHTASIKVSGVAFTLCSENSEMEHGREGLHQKQETSVKGWQSFSPNLLAAPGQVRIVPFTSHGTASLCRRHGSGLTLGPPSPPIANCLQTVASLIIVPESFPSTRCSL